jgi:anti-sigma factor RsiW
MNVTRNVVVDLLPLYLSGEASEDTRALLEEYLRQDPAFAAEVREQAAKATTLLAPPPVALPPDHERVTFERVRRFNRSRTFVLAFTIALALVPFSIVIEDNHVRWAILRDNPAQAVGFWVASLGAWIAYRLMGRGLRTVRR